MIYVVGERLGAQLASLCGVSEAELMAAVVWLNLWEYPGTDPDRYVRVVETAARPGDAVLLLGRRVAMAFGLGDLEPLGQVVRNAGRGPVILAVPHPSGLNRWWNDRENVMDAESQLRAVWGGHSR